MRFTEAPLAGVYIIDADVMADDRGSFTRAWMPREFEAMGLDTTIAQCSLAYNIHPNTVRGMHFQTAPMGEVKLVRVTRGALFDVAVDLRPDSPTYCRWFGVELTADNRRSLYIPKGFAHGYQTLTGHTEVHYMVSADYSPAHQAGVRYNDPAFGITWPLGAPTMIHERDAGYPDFVR
jgi:dTDP-4-dehydrorhamnose 3,5-epimerase